MKRRIEKLIVKLIDFFYGSPFITLAGVLILSALFCSQLNKINIDTSSEGLLHKTDQTRINYNAFKEQFGRDELIIVAVKSSNIFNDFFFRKLKELHNDLKNNVPYIEEIVSIINARNVRGDDKSLVVEDLFETWPDSEEKIEALRKQIFNNPNYINTIISEDGSFTAVIIETKSLIPDKTNWMTNDNLEVSDNDTGCHPLTDEENSEIVKAVKVITNKYQSPDFTIYTAGSPVVSHHLNQSVISNMRTSMAAALLIIIFSLVIFFKRLSGVVLPLIIVFLSLIATLSAMAMLKIPVSLVTQILPSFILIIGICDSIHILSIFYQHYKKTGIKKESIIYAFEHSGFALILTSVTTASGLLAFTTAEVAPIVHLGIYGAIGVILALVYTITILPSAIALLPLKPAHPQQNRADLLSKILTMTGRVATKHPYAVIAVFFIPFILSVFSLTGIRFSHNILQWFPADHPIRVATEKIDLKMRGTIGMEIIIDTRQKEAMFNPEMLIKIEEAGKYLEKLSEGDVFVGKAWSLTTIIKEINSALHNGEKAAYAIPGDSNLVAQEFFLFENSNSDDLEDFTDSEFQKARLRVKAPFVDAIQYAEFIEKVSYYFKSRFPDSDVNLTGTMALLFRAITATVTSMARSYFSAFITISLLMVLTAGNWRIGLLGIVPNVLPVIMVAGLIRLFNIPFDLFTMLIGSIALGLIVDDTIHFIHNFENSFLKSGNAEQAIFQTLHTSGRAMITTSCILALGFLAFTLSSMSNLFYFGLLTGATIVIALISDFLIVPALIIIFFNQTISTGGKN